MRIIAFVIHHMQDNIVNIQSVSVYIATKLPFVLDMDPALLKMFAIAVTIILVAIVPAIVLLWVQLQRTQEEHASKSTEQHQCYHLVSTGSIQVEQQMLNSVLTVTWMTRMRMVTQVGQFSREESHRPPLSVLTKTWPLSRQVLDFCQSHSGWVTTS